MAVTYNLSKMDGWKNLLSGIGTNKDKNSRNFFEGRCRITDEELADMYTYDGLLSSIIDACPDDAVREWYLQNEFEEMESDPIYYELDRLNVRKKINLALKWSRLYGGALIVLGVKGGGKLDQPLRANYAGIDYLKVYDRSQIQLSLSEQDNNKNSKRYGEYERFYIMPDGYNVKTGFNVHWSRCIVIKGNPVPYRSQNRDQDLLFWGTGIVDKIYETVSDYGVIKNGINTAMNEFSVGKFTLANLRDMLSANQNTALKKRMEIIDMTKSVINAVLLAEGEEYNRENITFSGISDIVDRAMMDVSAVSDIPVTRLFGRSPAGENATGEGDENNYYDKVKSYQDNVLRPALQTLINRVRVYIEVPFYNIEFVSLKQLSEKEKAEKEKLEEEKEKLEAEKYLTYVNAGVLSPEDVYNKVFEEKEKMGQAQENELE